LASGPEGSASDLARLLVSWLRGSPTTRELLDHGPLETRLRVRCGAELEPREELCNTVYGAAWQPGPQDLDRTAAALSAGRLDQLRRAWFRGSRCSVAVVSASEEPAPAAVAALESLPAGAATAPWAPRRRPVGGLRTEWTGAQALSSISHAARGPAPESPEGAAWVVGACLLGRGNGSTLFRRLRAERGLCYSVACRWLPEDGGLLWIEALCEPGDEDALEAALDEVLRETAQPGPGEAELERARGLAETDWTALLTSPSRRAWLRAQGMARGGAPDWVEVQRAALKEVSAQDIRRLGETLIADGVRLRIESR